jgi:replicative DNA helicase
MTDSIPVNLEAEQALLGSIFEDNKAHDSVRGFLRPEHFFHSAHQAIYAAIETVRAKGLKADGITLKETLASDPDVAGAGGYRYLATLMGCSNGSRFALDYARVVHDYARRRAVMSLCQEFSERAQTLDAQGMTAQEILGDMLKRVEAISTATSGSAIKTRREVMIEVAESLRHPPRCDKTGLGKLDALMAGGMFAGRAYAVAARKKTGKTSFLGTISKNLNDADVPHLFVCAEMGGAEIEHRAMGRELGVNPMSFLRPAKDGFAGRVGEAALKSKSASFYLDAPGISFERLRSEVSIAITRHGIKGFILDYLQIVTGQPRGQSFSEFTDSLSQWVATICRQEKIWALVACQMNQNEKANIRGGEGIRLAFDQVYHLERCEAEETGRYLDIMETRYTPYGHIGTSDYPGLYISPNGTHIEEAI